MFWYTCMHWNLAITKHLYNFCYQFNLLHIFVMWVSFDTHVLDDDLLVRPVLYIKIQNVQ